jgi:hypothetical protein
MVVSVECVQKSEHEEINMLSVIITAAFLYFLGFPFSRQNIFLMSVRHRKFGWLKKIIIISWNRIHVHMYNIPCYKIKDSSVASSTTAGMSNTLLHIP